MTDAKDQLLREARDAMDSMATERDDTRWDIAIRIDKALKNPESTPLLDAANAVLAHFMPTFNDSRAVDDCLVQLAAAVAGVPVIRQPDPLNLATSMVECAGGGSIPTIKLTYASMDSMHVAATALRSLRDTRSADERHAELRNQCQSLWRTDMTLVCRLPKSHNGMHRSDNNFTWPNDGRDYEVKQSPGPHLALKLPPLDRALTYILGRPSFACVRYAQWLREKGHVIGTKAEDEQAAVMHWSINLYLRHGSDWLQAADEYLTTDVPT